MDTHQIGTPDPGESLREKYSIIEQVKLELARTIIPVHIIGSSSTSSSGSSSSGGYPFVAGRGTVVPAAGTHAFVGISNPASSNRLVHIKRMFSKFTGATGFYHTLRSGIYVDVAARGGLAAVEATSSEAVGAVIYWGDVLTASLDVTGALDYYNAAPGVESFPDAWLPPGYFYGIGVQPAAMAIADCYFEGEEFDL